MHYSITFTMNREEIVWYYQQSFQFYIRSLLLNFSD